jgi:hypothetical protein
MGGGESVKAALTWTIFRAAKIPPRNTKNPEREAIFMVEPSFEENEVRIIGGYNFFKC